MTYTTHEGEYSDEAFEAICPYCTKQIIVFADEILESDTMCLKCPECGEEIDIIGDANELDSFCENCPGCAGCFKD